MQVSTVDTWRAVEPIHTTERFDLIDGMSAPSLIRRSEVVVQRLLNINFSHERKRDHFFFRAWILASLPTVSAIGFKEICASGLRY